MDRFIREKISEDVVELKKSPELNQTEVNLDPSLVQALTLLAQYSNTKSVKERKYMLDVSFIK